MNAFLLLNEVVEHQLTSISLLSYFAVQ